MKFRFSRNALCALPILLAFALSEINSGAVQAAPATTSVLAQMIPLVENGKARSVIVLPINSSEDETLAAQDLQLYLRKISGATVPITPRAAAKQIPIYLGQSAATPQLLSAIKAKGDDPASFALLVDEKSVRIAGLSPAATRFGVDELLEQLGVRWFMPGELGTVVPQNKTVVLPLQQTVQVPSFAGRWANAGKNFPEWGQHVRMGGPYFPPAHGVPGLKGKALFATHPEYFALVDGKRTPRQLDVSNPEVLRIAIEEAKKYFRANPDAPWIGMGPNDGLGYSEDAGSRALDGGDWDPFVNQISVTDRYIWFFNRVLDGLKDEFPGKKIAFYSYGAHMRPPVKFKPNPLIVPAFAPISLCRVHGMNNPICPERSYYKTVMAAWGKIVPESYERGYWFNLADPGFPWSEVHKMRDEIPVAHQLGLKGWRVETVDNWGSQTPSLYVAAKLMWNHQADVDALLEDFYAKFFGPAREPMARYCTLMDAALRDADFHTGSAFDMPHFYPPALRDQARRALDEAAQQSSGDYRKRVQIFRATFDSLETFISMLDNRNNFNWAAAQSDLNRLDELQKTLIAFDPPLINPVSGPSYLKRFFRQPVEQGFARAQIAGGKIVPLRDEWQFQLDQQKIGEAIGLYRADAIGNNWQTLKTSSLSWGDQGLRTYKGEAWYRQTVEIPADYAGQKVFLWFGGVDEKAKVWVNGQEVGVSHGAAFLPFEFDVSAQIRPGAPNVVSVRLVNERVDELGTGGITAPAMFYRPGAAATPDNVRELSLTFP